MARPVNPVNGWLAVASPGFHRLGKVVRILGGLGLRQIVVVIL